VTIIDSQVHAYEANTPKRPWHSVPNWPDHVTGDEMVAAMDRVGVDGAIFISAFSMYRYDASYAVEVQRAHPGRFAIVKPVDPDDPAVADVVADWKNTPGTVGIRIILTKEAKREPNDPGLDRILGAAVRHDFPVNILCWGNLDAGTALIDRHPDTRFIVDHLGIMQPRTPPAPPQPWADLPKVLELARRPNAVIKVRRRLHAVSGTVSIPGHLGPARPRVRCLGFRPLPGARTGHARSQSSTTSRPSSPSLRLAV
jgi:predicted TIM-barrel fold metal-dependent hydrolase